MERGHRDTPTHSFTNESSNLISKLIHQNKTPLLSFVVAVHLQYVTLKGAYEYGICLSCLALLSGTREISC